MGDESGINMTTGGSNTFLGISSGISVTTAINSTCIGNNSDNSSNFTDCVALGLSADASGDHHLTMGPNMSHINMVALASGMGTTVIYDGANILKSSSSRRYKENIKDITLDTSAIYKLRPVSFTWKDGGKQDFGYIAEEVYEHVPHVVFKNSAGQIEAVNYRCLTVPIIAEMGKLRNRVEVLEEENSKMKNLLAALEARLSILENK